MVLRQKRAVIYVSVVLYKYIPINDIGTTKYAIVSSLFIFRDLLREKHTVTSFCN